MRKHFTLLLAAAITTTLSGSGIYVAVDSLPVQSAAQPETVHQKSSPTPIPTTKITEQPASQTPPPTTTPQPQKPIAKTQVVARPVASTKPAALAGNVLSIPSIGFQGSIIDVGLTASNAIDVPAGMQVGRWNGGARPGALGATFLDGHVDGVFAKLRSVGVGQQFSIRYDGQTYNYQVVHAEVVQLQGIDMNRALNVYGGANEGVNMMTCAGKYVPSMGTYDQRLVVYAVRV